MYQSVVSVRWHAVCHPPEDEEAEFKTEEEFFTKSPLGIQIEDAADTGRDFSLDSFEF